MGIREVFIGYASGGELRFDEPMKDHTSLKIGGPVDILITPHDTDALASITMAAYKSGIPLLPLGGGTNLLVRDEGIEGAAVSASAFKDILVLDDKGENVRLSVGAGINLQKLVGFCKTNGLSGLEGLAGIPGSIGGAVAGNSGAYGYEIKDVIVSVSIMDTGGILRDLKRDEMGFCYRGSGIAAGGMVVGVEIELKKTSPEAVREKVADFHTKKKATQPLGERSAGCVFKNPSGEGVQPAGKLIEDSGCKGMRIGGIEVSRKHANFFIQKGGGTSDDFISLMESVARRVRDAFGVELEPEIRVVGRC